MYDYIHKGDLCPVAGPRFETGTFRELDSIDKHSAVRSRSNYTGIHSASFVCLNSYYNDDLHADNVDKRLNRDF